MKPTQRLTFGTQLLGGRPHQPKFGFDLLRSTWWRRQSEEEVRSLMVSAEPLTRCIIYYAAIYVLSVPVTTALALAYTYFTIVCVLLFLLLPLGRNANKIQFCYTEVKMRLRLRSLLIPTDICILFVILVDANA